MDPVSAIPVPLAREEESPYGRGLEAPRLELRPYSREELDRLFRGGEREVDECERWLSRAARARGGIMLAMAEGLLALKRGDRLPRLGFRLVDYAREVLGLEKRQTYALVQLATELRSRPLLREALRSGRVRMRAAQTVLPVAVGADEATWVERAASETVRVLEKLVAAARVKPAEPDEEWVRLRVGMLPPERDALDEALRVAERSMPGAPRHRHLEAMAMEFLGEHPALADDVQEPPAGTPLTDADWKALGGAFGATRSASTEREDREAELESENERWSHMPRVPDCPAPSITFPPEAPAREIDGKLRELARKLADWDAILGHHAQALRASGIYRTLGYASFGHYVEERLGLPASTVRQRADLESKLWASPALREARRQRLSYEKLRLLSRLPEAEIARRVAGAKNKTCIALARELDGERECQMRAQARLTGVVPRSTAFLLAAAFKTVCSLAGRYLEPSTCLAVLALHFSATYADVARRRRTNAQRIRDRDQGRCTVPGCSARAEDSHHVVYRSRGGHPTAPSNQTGECRFHHHACIHGGHLRLTGEAPGRLVWQIRAGRRWRSFTGR